MAKGRIAPTQLVAASTSESKTASWHSKLPLDDWKYITEVVDAMVNMPGSSAYAVAKGIIKELSLAVSTETVARKLREMVNNAS